MEDDSPSSSSHSAQSLASGPSGFHQTDNLNDRSSALSLHPDVFAQTLDSPSASTFLRTAETLEGLAAQLEQLKDERSLSDSIGDVSNVSGRGGGSAGGIVIKCCCGAIGAGCKTLEERERMEAKLKLSGEIGQALLQRYEALEQKLRRTQEQLEIKREALAESVRHVNALEKANATHLNKYAELSRKNEAVEKRLTQALHTQNLTQQSLTHVRTELATVRNNTKRQSLALSTGTDIQLAEADKRIEEARDRADVEAKKAKDELRKRKRAEDRIAELEEQLKTSAAEIEEVKAARAKDAQELLANAKDRLAILHSELSATFNADSPEDMPQYQRALEELVANNTLLKHETAELTRLLSDSRDESRVLKDEVDELRMQLEMGGGASTGGIRGLVSLASELGRSESFGGRMAVGSGTLSFAERAAFARLNAHARNNSVAIIGNGGPMSAFSSMTTSRAPGLSAWEHHRRSSMAPSFVSTSSTTDPGGNLTSPGLGMGPIGEYNARIDREATLSPVPTDGRQSPSLRTSPSGGIPYHINGVPKARRPRPVSRQFSDRRSSMRSFSQGVESIAEWAADDEQSAADLSNITTDEPLSPGVEYFHPTHLAESSNRNKRASILIARTRAAQDQHDSVDPSPNQSMIDQSMPTPDMPSPMSEGASTSPQKTKRVHRRTLLLLSRSRGVQTDPVDENTQTNINQPTTRETSAVSCPSFAPMKSQATSTATSPNPQHGDEQRSETSSVHETQHRSAITFAHLIDHLAKMLAKLHDADIPTLNRRLKKQHLLGDVGHLSRSTMRALYAEATELRHKFRGMDTTVERKELVLMLKLLKEVFSDLVQLQSVVNEVVIDPSVAKRLQREAYRDEEDEGKEQQSVTAGLGWIAAPLTKFFVTSDENPAVPPISTIRCDQRGRSGRPPAPKQSASTSATTTTVSVEFGGSGIVRRSTPAVAPATSAPVAALSSGGGMEPHQSSSIDHGLPSPNTLDEQQTRSVSAPMRASTNASKSLTTGAGSGGASRTSSLAPPTLRPSKSRANRSELLGIFAGAQSGAAKADPWVVVPGGVVGGVGGSRLRAANSRYLGGNTGRQQRDYVPGGNVASVVETMTSGLENARRNGLSTTVDAVIDPTAMETHDPSGTGGMFDPTQPPLLERTLRPRGLSDSSIRSTFLSQEIADAIGSGGDSFPSISSQPSLPAGASVPPPSSMAGPVPSRATGYPYIAPVGMLESISRRLYNFRSGAVAGSPSQVGEGEGSVVHTAVASPSPSNNSIASASNGAGVGRPSSGSSSKLATVTAIPTSISYQPTSALSSSFTASSSPPTLNTLSRSPARPIPTSPSSRIGTATTPSLSQAASPTTLSISSAHGTTTSAGGPITAGALTGTSVGASTSMGTGGSGAAGLFSLIASSFAKANPLNPMEDLVDGDGEIDRALIYRQKTGVSRSTSRGSPGKNWR